MIQDEATERNVLGRSKFSVRLTVPEASASALPDAGGVLNVTQYSR
jgi:hypothetical protein